jgi:hypothetical protein
MPCAPFFFSCQSSLCGHLFAPQQNNVCGRKMWFSVKRWLTKRSHNSLNWRWVFAMGWRLCSALFRVSRAGIFRNWKFLRKRGTQGFCAKNLIWKKREIQVFCVENLRWKGVKFRFFVLKIWSEKIVKAESVLTKSKMVKFCCKIVCYIWRYV